MHSKRRLTSTRCPRPHEEAKSYGPSANPPARLLSARAGFGQELQQFQPFTGNFMPLSKILHSSSSKTLYISSLLSYGSLMKLIFPKLQCRNPFSDAAIPPRSLLLHLLGYVPLLRPVVIATATPDTSAVRSSFAYIAEFCLLWNLISLQTFHGLDFLHACF